ncbi:tyrosine-type recombinase/integrase [Bacteroides fragilis]|uniref:tyrosine-type recombinase/integrase n=1 Tax=Bacteroides fragilis TaxID=817 RepID=UPI00202E6A62|nr:site-specific integrase [Bacteroides fragilis]MCM0316887.1 site-specific integrase [Bacteroides fragilis]
MAKLENKVKENPKLEQNTLSDGRISLYLNYYLGRSQYEDEKTGKIKIKHNRKKEFLELYLITNPRTPLERLTNKETLEKAIEIRAEREQELKQDRKGYRIFSNRKINIFDFMQSYYNNYTKGDIRMIKAAIKRFKDFIRDEYPLYKTCITPEQIDKEMISKFVEFLQSTSRGEGAATHYKRFKKIIKYAVEKEIIKKNPCTGVVCRADESALKKDILSMEEITQLIQTTYPQQNINVRRAFIFCLYTGMRFCDVVELIFKNVDYGNKVLIFNQKKTQGHSSHSWVTIPLNDGLLSVIGTGKENEKVFDLPSNTMCLKALRHWVKKAGINKHITWHCARHSFAVNILNNGANIKTVASLLGHSSLSMTEKYTRAVDSLKEAAINSLPELKL